MAVSNIRSKGLIASSIKCLRNVNIFCNGDSNIFQRKCSFYNLSFNKYKICEAYKASNPSRNFCTVKAIKRKIKLNEFRYCSTSTFQQLLLARKKQAERSVLIELNNKTYIPHATSTCQQFGTISNLYSYRGESENVFLLLEFDHEDSVKKLLSHCQYKYISDSFVAHSRTVHFESKLHLKSSPEMTVKVNEDDEKRVLIKGETISELIEDIYRTEKISELNTRLRFFFCLLVKESLSGVFPHCEVLPFGSSVNGIGRHGCDLDLMLRLYPLQTNETSEFNFLNKTCIGTVQDLQKKSLNVLGNYFRTFLPGITLEKKILHARVPILKVYHKLLAIECDLSVNNMSAILMSEMLYFCGEIDSRVRPLLYAVKKWAKEAKVTYDAPGPWITNFGLTLLVVFFLQNRPAPILPALNDVIEIIGADCTSNFHLKYVITLPELQAKASLNTESLAALMKEFLAFLVLRSFKDKHLSILTGKATERQTKDPIWVQYPLEEHKNVTQNISSKDLEEICAKALISANSLAANMQLQHTSSDLSSILGIQTILKNFGRRKNDFNLLTDDLLKHTKRSYQRAN